MTTPNPYTARPDSEGFRRHNQTLKASLQLENLLRAVKDVCPFCFGTKKVGREGKTCSCVAETQMARTLSRVSGYGDITWTPLTEYMLPTDRKNLIIRLEGFTCKREGDLGVVNGDGFHQETRDVIFTHLKCAIKMLGNPNFTWVDSTLQVGMSGLLNGDGESKARAKELLHADLLVMFAETAINYSAIARHIGQLIVGRSISLSDAKADAKGEAKVTREVVPLVSWLVIPDGDDFNTWLNRASTACLEDSSAQKFKDYCLNECRVVTINAKDTLAAIGSARTLSKGRSKPKLMKRSKTLPLVAEAPWT